MRRIIELSRDYIFDGCASMDYLVFDLPARSRGPKYEVKTMWAQCEILIGCMTALEYTGEVWAKEWYERARAFALRTKADPKHSLALSGDKMIPWHFSAEHKPGDILNLGFQMDVPLEFPVGAARIGVVMDRHPKGRGWESADLWDEKGKAVGTTFWWPVKVVKEDVGGQATSGTRSVNPNASSALVAKPPVAPDR